MVAMTVMVMVIGALGGLARTIQQSYEYSDGYGVSTQNARIALDRICQNVASATANAKFPGCWVVADTVGSYRYPDELVVWRPRNADGTWVPPNSPPPHADGVPRYNELVIYCPRPDPLELNAAVPTHFQLVEIKPTNTGSVPAVTNTAGWVAGVTARKADSPITVLTNLLRACSTSASGGPFRGAARFEIRLLPSDNQYQAGLANWAAWANLPWVQGIYGRHVEPQTTSSTGWGEKWQGLRQVWMRMELQLIQGSDLIETNPSGAQVIPYFGSAALYYELTGP
jgi:hypothetical protein